MSRPIGVKVLAIVGYLGVAWLLMVAVLMAFAPGKLGSIASLLRLDSGYGRDFGTIHFRISIAAILVALAGLEFAISRGLWRLQSWARRWTIVLCAISLLVGGGFFIGRLINLLSAAYLLGGEAKSAFGVERQATV